MIELTLIENDINSFKNPMQHEMEKPIKHFEGELIKIRTGRAHTSMIEDIPVTAYAQAPAPLKNYAALAAPEAQLLTVQPWDQSIIGDIERAIQNSDIGLTPINDGKIIRLQLPKVSSERRDELLKVLGKKAEECKIAIRNVRKDFKNEMKKAKDKKTISENFFNRLSDVLEEVTENFIKKTDTMAKKKEQDITTI
jgi:ribosome recycling factor